MLQSLLGREPEGEGHKKALSRRDPIPPAPTHLCVLSQRKQPSKNDKKGASVHRSAVDRSRDPGLRFFPLELATMRGCSDESKNIFALLLLSIKWRGGTPMTSMMQASCSTSFSPGNRGYPVYLQVL